MMRKRVIGDAAYYAYWAHVYIDFTIQQLNANPPSMSRAMLWWGEAESHLNALERLLFYYLGNPQIVELKLLESSVNQDAGSICLKMSGTLSKLSKKLHLLMDLDLTNRSEIKYSISLLGNLSSILYDLHLRFDYEYDRSAPKPPSLIDILARLEALSAEV
ncbi:MAG: hypothetical protein ACXQTI_10095 [Candidatus Nezhaarchaeales archaeon]